MISGRVQNINLGGILNNMIPRKIYHIWISEIPVPETFKQFTDTWSKVMPDYEIVDIRLKDVPINELTTKFIENKQWALLNHYTRYYYLWKYGGIYMDLDIEVIKPFDNLLTKELVIGREDNNWINNAVMACEEGNTFMKKCVEYMESFDYSKPNVELETGPRLVTKIIKDNNLEDIVLSYDYFYPYHYTQEFNLGCIKLNTYAIHHWNHSWKKQTN